MSRSVGFLDASGDPLAPSEPWQQLSPCGMYVKCLPCNKVIDAAHLETPDHERRLQEWQRWQDHLQSDYPEPAAPHLAYVPHDEDVLGQRWMKCLLCNKWVHDEHSHEGTIEDDVSNLRCSKLHRRNLKKYPPSDTWYQENVVRVKAKYHPKASAQPEQTASASSAHPAPATSSAPLPPQRPPGMPPMMPPPTPQPEQKRPRVRRQVELSLPPRGEDATRTAVRQWVWYTTQILDRLPANKARVACEGLAGKVVRATVETSRPKSYLVKRAVEATLGVWTSTEEDMPTQSVYDFLNILADDDLLTNEVLYEEEDNTPALPTTE